MTGQGRGRGEALNIHRIEDEPGSRGGLSSSSSGGGTQGGDSGDTGERAVRGRGGYRSTEVSTIPANVTQLKADIEKTSEAVKVYANYVRIVPMKQRDVHKYRVDFKPQIESTKIRKDMVRDLFAADIGNYVYDGYSDARGSKYFKELEKTVPNPAKPSEKIVVTVKHVGKVDWSSYEMTRLYNMHARDILRDLGYYAMIIQSQRAMLHPDLITPVGTGRELHIVGGFKTAVNVHMNHEILCNIETAHKVYQVKNVLQMLADIRNSARGNWQETARTTLTNKLVTTAYVKRVYKIEDIIFDQNPSDTFTKDDREVSFIEYFNSRYGIRIAARDQPLLLCTQHGKRPGNEEGRDEHVRLVPELCNMAGLTEEQINRARRDMITATQIAPQERMNQLRKFLKQMHDEPKVRERFEKWGYKFEEQPLQINARVLAPEHIQLGSAADRADPKTWPKVDHNASFDMALIRDKLVKRPEFPKLAILIPRSCHECYNQIIGSLRTAFSKIGLTPVHVNPIRMVDGENTSHYLQYLKQVPDDTTATIVLMPNQNKEKYDAIKKHASCERGLITQVVTARLMTDQRKASGAAVKIGIQIAAKIGGEPWYVNFPLKDVMVCGYDTYHDTVNRRCSFGAFVASMNEKCSRWYSKVDRHDQIEELSSHLTENLILAMRKYKEKNGKFPDRLFIYRDGVGEGQLDHVHQYEVQQINRAIREIDGTVRLTFIIVTKRIGARFFFQAHENAPILNCKPGTIVDDTVTRMTRYDFYLISQSTRAGTVSPTYYNIVFDESSLKPQHHQMMAYKFCFLYYNWAGSVRVPAPCQYAHKLALLCGEHLHQAPHQVLDDRLHFL